MTVLILLLLGLVTGLLGQSTGDDCLQRYASCWDEFELNRDGFLVHMKCITNATEECFPLLVDIPKGYEKLIEKEFNGNFTQEWLAMSQCVLVNLENYGCRYEGEFATAGEFCSSTDHLYECLILKTKEKCGKDSGILYRKLLKPFRDFFATCQTSKDLKDYRMPICYQELLKCDRNFFNSQGYSCSSFAKNLRCYVDALRGHCVDDDDNNLFLSIFESYVAQIPDYCNPQSDFRQNLEKSLQCLLMNMNVVESCYKKYESDINKIASDEDDESAEVSATTSRTIVRFFKCIRDGYDSVCGEEGSFVTKFLTRPVEEAMDNNCMELTGDKCNGTSGLETNLALLLLCISYIIVRKDG